MASTILVICEACSKRHEVATIHAGRRGKCSGCGALMTVPTLLSPDKSEIDSEPDEGDYGLAPVAESSHRTAANRVSSRFSPEDLSSFHRSGQESARRERAGRDSTSSETDFALVVLRAMPVGLGLVLVLMLILAFAVTGGTRMAGSLACGAGMILSLACYWVGAYAAFREDSLYGFLYVLIPLYTAYYIVSRFDDLKNWIYVGLVGLVLSMIGGALVLMDEPPKLLEAVPVAMATW